MPVSPITPLVVGNNGAFKHLRASPAQGSCGTRGYPCLHPGVDLYGRAGTPVVAPEAGVVVAVADGAAPPFGGYGPWLVMIQGASGKFHLLSHLAPATASMAPLGARVAEGQQIGTTSVANHTHWEVRERPTPPAGKTNLDNNVDPIAWMRGGATIVLALVLGLGGYYIWKRTR